MKDQTIDEELKRMKKLEVGMEAYKMTLEEITQMIGEKLGIERQCLKPYGWCGRHVGEEDCVKCDQQGYPKIVAKAKAWLAEKDERVVAILQSKVMDYYAIRTGDIINWAIFYTPEDFLRGFYAAYLVEVA